VPATDPTSTVLERRNEAQRAKERGNKRFQGRQYERAIEEYTAALELAPEKGHKEVAVFYGNRAQCYSSLSPPKYAEAEADCDRSLEIDPRYVKAMCRRAIAREKQSKIREAFIDFTAAALLSGFSNEVAVEGTERVLKQVATLKAQERLQEPMTSLPSATFISTFIDSFKSHRDLLARPRRQVAPLTAALAADPAPSGAALARLYCERALARMVALEHEAAMEDWSAAVALLPPHADGEFVEWEASDEAATPVLALCMNGMYLHLRGNYAEAMASYDYALQLDPGYIPVLLKRASLWFEKEDLPKALADFSTALEARPDHPDIFCHRGQLYILQNEIASALDDLRKAVDLDPDSILARIQLGMALHRSGQQNEARSTFSAAESRFPDSPEVLNYYGELLLEAQDVEGAASKFRAALKLSDDTFALAHVNLGVLQLHGLQDAAGALQHCEEAIKVDPLCETAHVHMAHLRLQTLDLEGAVSAYDKAVSLLRMKQELVDCYSMREAAAAQLSLLEAQPDIYGDLKYTV